MNLCALLLTTLFTFVELNCENLFDYTHDEGKDDMEWTPTSIRHWNKGRYWRKLNNIGQEIISCGETPSLNRERLRVGEQSSGMGRGGSPTWQLPDMVALCEVENDSVIRDLTKRSMLRNAGYEYLITQSPDLRGIDVAVALCSYFLPTHPELCPQGKAASGDATYTRYSLCLRRNHQRRYTPRLRGACSKPFWR